MHHDGMHFFPLGRGRRGQRSAACSSSTTSTPTRATCTPARCSRRPADDQPRTRADMVRKSQAAHGVSVVEIAPRRRRASGRSVRSPLQPPHHRQHRRWPSPARPPATGCCRRGRPAGTTPARHAQQLRPRLHPVGHLPDLRGELQRLLPARRRAPTTPSSTALLAATASAATGTTGRPTTRASSSRPDDPNEPNRFGWVVEIDPFDPTSTPVKRTALGPDQARGRLRPRHQGRPGRRLHGRRPGQRLRLQVRQRRQLAVACAAAGRSPLDEGTLYVARFDDDGTRRVAAAGARRRARSPPANGFADQGDVLVKTRLAADALGATPMDRPEWTSVDPRTGIVY